VKQGSEDDNLILLSFMKAGQVFAAATSEACMWPRLLLLQKNMKKKTQEGRSKQARGGKENERACVLAAEKASNPTPSLLPRNRLLNT
jgi:hypothetical protein